MPVLTKDFKGYIMKALDCTAGLSIKQLKAKIEMVQ
jgi:hypothetical protein